MKILIIGGVAAGMSCAARARRLSEDSKIIVFERSGHVSFANCGLPYHIGDVIERRESLLLQTPQTLAKTLNLDVRILSEVVSIDKKSKTVRVKNLSDGTEYSESYDKLVIATGSSPIKPPIPGADLEKVFVLRNIEDMDAIKSLVDSGNASRAVVIGGGYIGVEVAENLVERGIKVHLVELLDQILPPFDKEMAKDLQNHMSQSGVLLHLGAAAAAFRKNPDGRISVELQNSEKIGADFVVLSVGVRPDSKLASESGIETNARGGIKVDSRMRTSDPDIFAAGDAVEVLDFVTGAPSQIPLAGPANRQGRIIADNIFGRSSEYKATVGTAILKVFKMSGACAGASEKALKKAGLSYQKVYLHPSNHAGYYPGSTPIHLKVLFSLPEGKLLGAQAVGFEGVDKRIDVLATAIKAGMTVYDLEELELSYAPPFGSAKDPVNMAGFIASNILRGDMDCWYPEDFPGKTDGGLIVDVRPADMFEIWHVPGAVNIPLPVLRTKISELPKDKNVFLYCKVGFSSYLAYRILKQNGFGENGKLLKTLSGGVMSFCCHHGPGVCASERNKPFIPYTAEPMQMEKFEENKNEQNADDNVLDLRGLQCPGPIMRIREFMEKSESGSTVTAIVSDPGFASDIAAWCEMNFCKLLSVSGTAPEIRAVIRKGSSCPSDNLACRTGSALASGPGAITIVVFSGDLDKVLAAFVIANGALAMGKRATLFFTFWGLNALRKKQPQSSGKSVLDFMFGEMMPKGPEKLALSKMDMCGMGTMMMKHVMKSKNVESLPSLMDSAIKSGAKLVACSMSMDVMGLRKEELIDEIEIGGVATFLSESDKSNGTLFI